MPGLRLVQEKPSVEVRITALGPTTTVVPLPQAERDVSLEGGHVQVSQMRPSGEVKAVSWSPLTPKEPMGL